MSASRGRRGRPGPGESPLTRGVVRLLLAASLVVAAAFLVKGHAGTGGGFSAALVAGSGILYGYLGLGAEAMRRMPLVRLARPAAGAGLLLALGVGLGPTAAGLPPFTHFPADGAHPPGLGTLQLDSAFLFETAIFLVALGVIVAAVDAVDRSGPLVPEGEGGGGDGGP